MARERLLRLRWGVRGALALGVAVSIAANILHAPDHWVARCVSAWPPLSLLVILELITRVPVTRRWLTASRTLAAVSVAMVAAYVSYGHMAYVAGRYGEDGISRWLWPLTVDGLVVVAAACLTEIDRRLRTFDLAPAPEVPVRPVQKPDVPPAGAKRPPAKSRARGGGAQRVREILATQPDIPAGELAAAAGLSDRHTRRLTRQTAKPVNGHNPLAGAERTS